MSQTVYISKAGKEFVGHNILGADLRSHGSAANVW